jgi:hypothetical protein
MTWKSAIEERQEIVLTTASKDGKPHAIVVISLGLVEESFLSARAR